MPYLPPPVLNDTILPMAQGYDLNLMINLIEERWRRFYPLIAYYALLKPLVAATSLTNDIAHSTGTTAVDTLYGEAVDPTMVTNGWAQPHLSSEFAATDVEQYAEPVNIYARVPHHDPDGLLHKYGFDRVREAPQGTEVVIPLSFFDRLGITCSAGDKLMWDGDEYIVKQELQSGYWKNTNLRLYMRLNVEHRRKHSS